MPNASVKRSRVMVVFALILTVGVMFSRATPAQAIIGGEADGNQHPYAGAIEIPPGSGLVVSGVLISPTVFLTAGHATRRLDDAGITRARVTFDPVVGASSVWFTGTVHTNPAYDPQSADDPADFGVVVFDAPIPGIAPASLPTAGQLDALGPQGLQGQTFTVVGYGFSRIVGGSNGGGTPRPDLTSGGIRKVAQQSFLSLTKAWLRVQQHDNGQICTRDSGSPSLFGGTNVIAGISIIILGQCRNDAWDMRVDTPSACGFLGHFVSLP